MFVPAMVRALRGYGRADFLADLGAGVTVGIIALPLAIGFGIASGVTPQQGLWTGIIASIAVALFGGSRFSEFVILFVRSDPDPFIPSLLKCPTAR